MAETTETEALPEEEAPKAKLSLMQILLIVAVVVVTQVVVKFTLDAVVPPATVDAESEAEEVVEEEVLPEELPPPNYLPLDPALLVNLEHDGKSQYLQTTIQLMTRDAEVYEAAKVHAPAIRNALIMLFSQADFEALHTVEGKEALQEEARVTTDDVLQELSGVKGVDKIYLTSILFQ